VLTALLIISSLSFITMVLGIALTNEGVL